MTNEEFNSLKKGDKVRIVDFRGGGMNNSGDMDKYLGTVMTVHSWKGRGVSMEEDGQEWYWSGRMISEKISFTKSELKPCMLVQFRNGDLRIVAKANGDLIFVDPNTGKVGEESYYSDTLENMSSCERDIVAVYGYKKLYVDALVCDTKHRDLIWEREEKVEEMTLEQVCKELGKTIKIVK